MSKSKDIINYINGVVDGKIVEYESIEKDTKRSNERQLDNQLSWIDISKTNKKNEYNNEKNSIVKESIFGNKKTKITIPKGLLFEYLEISSVDANNPDNFGILYLSRELKELAKTKDYKKYPISTAILIRSLLEQALKYHLRKLGEWDSFVLQENKKNRNSKEPGLESIINYCNGNTKRIFNKDTKVQRDFNMFAKNIGTKEYFDMIIHHPESAVADSKILEKITNNGLYRVIRYIFNNT